MVTLQDQKSLSVLGRLEDLLKEKSRLTPTPAVMASLRFLAVAMSSRVR